jgi:hypothetical protein
MVGAAAESESATVICEVCRALPKPEQKQVRNRAMTRMLRASLLRKRDAG